MRLWPGVRGRKEAAHGALRLSIPTPQEHLGEVWLLTSPFATADGACQGVLSFCSPIKGLFGDKSHGIGAFRMSL